MSQLLVQRKPLNVITLGPLETDNIKRLLTIFIKCPTVIFSKCDLRTENKRDHIKQPPLSNIQFKLAYFSFLL